MEVSFLLSELAGKRIKEFTEEIDIQEDFDEYFSDYWPYFERIVKTFSWKFRIKQYKVMIK